jgi:hypothetical protein
MARLSSIMKKVSKIFNVTAVNFAVENTHLPELCAAEECRADELSVIDIETE